MTVHHDAELDAVAATMPGLRPCGLRMERPGAVEIKVIDAGASGGRSKCMSGRQSARTRHVSAKATIPGDTQQAAKSIRVRNAGEDCFPRPVRLASDHRPYALSCACGSPCVGCESGIRVLACKCGRRGRGSSSSRSARPYRASEDRNDRLALWPE
jgi:hypothetical protein